MPGCRLCAAVQGCSAEAEVRLPGRCCRSARQERHALALHADMIEALPVPVTPWAVVTESRGRSEFKSSTDAEDDRPAGLAW